MELAQRDAVADDRLALGVAVGRDVRRPPAHGNGR
jgi:hypothetical protein